MLYGSTFVGYVDPSFVMEPTIVGIQVGGAAPGLTGCQALPHLVAGWPADRWGQVLWQLCAQPKESQDLC